MLPWSDEGKSQKPRNNGGLNVNTGVPAEHYHGSVRDDPDPEIRLKPTEDVCAGHTRPGK